MRPSVSVCIPIHNGERYLAATLDSVLSSDHHDLEVVAIDNASTDGTAAILAACPDPRLRVVRTPRLLPLGLNWIFAMDQLRGTYVKVVCADDLISPECIGSQVAILEGDPSVSVVACRRDIIDGDGRPLTRNRGLGGLIGRRDGRRLARQVHLLGINPLGEPNAVTFRLADYHAVGGWNPERVYPMELDLWLRLSARGRIFGQARTMAAFRVSGYGLTSQHSEQQFAEIVELADSLVDDWQIPRWQRFLAPVGRRLMWWTNGVRASLRARLRSAVASDGR